MNESTHVRDQSFVCIHSETMNESTHVRDQSFVCIHSETMNESTHVRVTHLRMVMPARRASW
jgi:hypothetical protein